MMFLNFGSSGLEHSLGGFSTCYFNNYNIFIGWATNFYINNFLFLLQFLGLQFKNMFKKIFFIRVQISGSHIVLP